MSESLVLIGFKAAGKTTLARTLADTLSIPMYDMDNLLIDKYGYQDIKKCFHVLGEQQFRNAELDIVKELSLCQELKIIATGGGVIENQELMESLKKIGKILFLNTNYQLIEERLFQDEAEVLYLNQNIQRAELKAIYENRLPLYLRYADIIIGDD